MEQHDSQEYLAVLIQHANSLGPKDLSTLAKHGIHIGENDYFSTLLFAPKRPDSDWMHFLDVSTSTVIQEQILRAFYGNEVFYSTVIGGLVCCLICYPYLSSKSEFIQAQDNLNECLSRLHTQFQQLLPAVPITIIKSSAVCGFRNLQSIYARCQDLYEYFQFMGEIPDLYLADLEKGHKINSDQFEDMKYAATAASRFMLLLQSGRTEEYPNLLEQLYQNILYTNTNSVKIIHYRALTFVDQLLLLLSETELISRQFLLDCGIYTRVTMCQNVEEMKCILQALIQALHSELSKSSCLSWTKKSSHSEQICHYIDANLSDVTMDINQLAMKFHISQPLLSTSFKQFYGMSPSEYIRKKRIHLVKQYLRETDKTLHEISILSGFGSISTMQRSFRSQTGISPGRYRMQSRALISMT